MQFKSDAEVWEVVRRFERCEFDLAEFDHGCHLAVGMAYLSVASFEEAMARMRRALEGFSGHHGKMGYHETMTRFWLLRLVEIGGEELWQRANGAISKLGDKNLIFEYYRREVLMSPEARERWILPHQLKPTGDEAIRTTEVMPLKSDAG
jgi:hypothetical protein